MNPSPRRFALTRLAPLAVLLLPVAPAGANPPPAGGGVVRWRGMVGREVALELQGDQLRRRDGGDSDDRIRISAGLPDDEAIVYGRILRGRALVSVDEQPRRLNDWTATVRV